MSTFLQTTVAAVTLSNPLNSEITNLQSIFFIFWDNLNSAGVFNVILFFLACILGAVPSIA